MQNIANELKQLSAIEMTENLVNEVKKRHLNP